MDWQIKLKGVFILMKVIKIEKLVSEYNVWELEKTPYAKFKIKIYVNESGTYSGYANLQIIDENGNFNCAVGWGENEKEALDDTLESMGKMLSRKAEWEENEFKCSDAYDF